jgi:hypothetical protein
MSLTHAHDIRRTQAQPGLPHHARPQNVRPSLSPTVGCRADTLRAVQAREGDPVGRAERLIRASQATPSQGLKRAQIIQIWRSPGRNQQAGELPRWTGGWPVAGVF